MAKYFTNDDFLKDHNAERRELVSAIWDNSDNEIAGQYTKGKNGVWLIEYRSPNGKRDFVDVHFEDGKIVRSFCPDSIVSELYREDGQDG